jgi:SAM-dependent methyltransferase
MLISVGHPPRWDARCPQCGSGERHRLTHLWFTEGGSNKLAGKRVLHFAPEKAVVREMRDNPLYETADLHQTGVTHRIDIYDVVIAHHVLGHIDDDRQAMRELFRILKPGGIAVLSVPINATRPHTYENEVIRSPEQRFAISAARITNVTMGWTLPIAWRVLGSEYRTSACQPRRRCTTDHHWAKAQRY